MPSSTSQCAVSVPSRSQGSARNAPPGTMIIAVPFDKPGAGRKTVSVGTVTLVMMWTLPRFGSSASTSSSAPVQFSVPGGRPGQMWTIWDELGCPLVASEVPLQPIDNMASAALPRNIARKDGAQSAVRVRLKLALGGRFHEDMIGILAMLSEATMARKLTCRLRQASYVLLDQPRSGVGGGGSGAGGGCSIKGGGGATGATSCTGTTAGAPV